MWGMKLRLIALLPALLLASPASAQTEPEPAPEPQPQRHFGGQRTFGFGPSAGLTNGLGGMAGLRLSPLELWVTGGYMPVLVFGNKHDLTRSVTLDGYASGQVGADVALTPWHAGTRYDFGLLASYRYNTALGNGGGAGVVLHIDLTGALALFFSLDYVVFPDARDALGRLGYPNDRDPSVPWLQGGANVGLVVYPP
jgi:hypothetical protein